MRLAVVVSPPRSSTGPIAAASTAAGAAGSTGPNAGAATGPNVAAQAIGARLVEAGFRVVELATTPLLEADYAKTLEALEPGGDLVTYVAGRTALLGADAALRVEGAHPAGVTFRAMGNAAAARDAAAALFVVDAEHDGDARDAMAAAEHVDGVVRALDARARGFAVIVGARADADEARWPLTTLLARAFVDPSARADDGAVRVGRVYERLRAYPELAQAMQSYTFVRGKADVALAPPPPPVSSLPPPPAPPSLAPRPHLTPLLLGAEEACERQDWDEALDAFKKALMLVGNEDAAARATVYANIGEVKRAQGKPREAELNFEKALGAVPTHRRSIEALVEMAVAERDPKRVLERRTRLVAALPDDAARARELVRIAEVQRDDLDDARAATETLERARALAPADAEVLERLRGLYEKIHRWPKVMEVLEAMADAAPTGEERARLRFEQADVALGRLRDEPRGLALLDASLVDDPRHDDALHAIAAVLTKREDYARLAELYARLVDLHARERDVERAWDVCRRLGMLRRDKLRDGPGALDAFAGAAALKPNDADTRAMLVDLYLAKHDEPAALAELEAMARIAPTRPSTFVRLHQLHARGGRRDRAWLAASALVELGHATPEQRVLYEEMRPDGTLWPARSLDHEVWDTMLRAPGGDDVVTGILGAIVPAAVKAKRAELAAEHKVAHLDPARRQPPSSTASIVRCFVWAAQVLGVTLPELYVLDDVPGGVAAAQTEPPATAIGPALLQGIAAQDLAFVVGRHLAYYRPEHYALVFFPSLAELSALFLAAVKLALPEVPVPHALHEHIARMRGALAAHVTPEERGWLETAVRQLEARGGRVDLAAWVRSVELTANRAGLLLCGDLGVAARRVKSETRAIADVLPEERRQDLLAFVASPELADLRAALAITARPSSVPPPRSSPPP